jgi:hypothetical protein
MPSHDEEKIMPDWSIKIITTKKGAAFVPDLQGYQPGDALPTRVNDLVTWNNTTNDTHQPWPTDSNYKLLPDPVPRDSDNYLSDPIPPQGSSRPSYVVTQPLPPEGPPATWTVYYGCKLHPTAKSERGTIDGSTYPNT